MKRVILIAEREFSPQAMRMLARVGRVIPFGSRSVFFKNLPRAHVVVAGLEVNFTKAVLDRAPRLELVASRTTQLRHIDRAETARRGIAVVHIKGDSPVLRQIPSTAEETFALVLALVRNIPWAMRSLEAGRWERRRYGGHELAGKTFGVIGFGRLGSYVARYARAFGMRVIAYDPYVSASAMARGGARRAGLNALLRAADVVSVHCVYSDRTAGMLGARHFRLMKPTAVFINTARGEIADESALLAALKAKRIAGAAVDTLAGETPDGAHVKTHPLVDYARTHENMIIVPHLGGATREATEKSMLHIAELTVQWCRRHPL